MQSKMIVVYFVLIFNGCNNNSVAPTAPTVSEHFFNYPWTLGTSWTYHYHYFNGPHVPRDGITESRQGTRLWEIISVSISDTVITCIVSSKNQDTISQIIYSDGQFVRDTTVFANSQSQFSIMTFRKTILANWLSTVRYSTAVSPEFSRIIKNVGDTVKVNGDFNDWSLAWYVDGVGLIYYDTGHTSPMTSYYEILELIR
jgi:hypothetical protein